MSTCVLCHHTTELDDVVVSGPPSRCVCLGCYLRETGGVRRMARDLRQAVDAALAAADL